METMIIGRTMWLMLAGTLAAIALPGMITNKFIIDILTLILFSAFLGQSWNILGGYAGQFSFGGVVFFGTGAYASSILLTTFGIDPWIGVFAAIAAGVAVAAFIGFVSFRYGLRGSYFALITLAFSEVFRTIANSVEFTGGGVGIFIEHQPSLARLQFDHPAGFYYVALVMTLISLAIPMWFERSRFGARLIAIRENEDAAEALGVNAFRCKMYAIMITGGMGGAAGTFYAQKYLYLDPPIAYGVAQSIEMLLVTIVGGLGTVFGPLVGSFVLHGVNEVSRHYISEPGLSLIVYGVILVGIVGFLPDGLIGLFKSRVKKISGDDDA
jgi:branched-chain amino acid transport system permease protein